MSRRLVLLGLVLVAVTGLAVVLSSGIRSAAGTADLGTQVQRRDQPAPALRGTSLDGAPFDLADLRGKVVLVNVWASWCDPCRRELPVFVDAQDRWSGQGFAVAGIDIRDNPESARRMLAELGARELTSVADPLGVTAVAWGARGVPETFLVDRAGRVRWWVQGAVDQAWLQQHIPDLLGP